MYKFGFSQWNRVKMQGPSILADRRISVVLYYQSNFMGVEGTSSYMSEVFLCFYWSVQFFSAFHWSPFTATGRNGPKYRMGPDCAGRAYL